MKIQNKNLYDKLRLILSEENQTVNILQESIDVLLQMSYFKLTKKAKKNIRQDIDYLSDVTQLYDPEVDLSKKKLLLCTLASIDDPKYFRAIETFKENAPEELKDWTTLALQESKMLLESSLLDTKQLYISTGLGGKGESLRFFAAIINKTGTPFDSAQREIIEKEFDFQFRQQNGEIEEIEFNDKYAQIMCLLPLELNVGDVVKGAVKECNTYGGFIEDNFLLTNVKKLNTEEINQLLENPKMDDEEDDDELYMDDFDLEEE